jgi:hypothetical protein
VRQSCMALNFESHVLPLLLDLADFSGSEYPLMKKIREFGLSEDSVGDKKILAILEESGYVAFKRLTTLQSDIVMDVRLTVRGMQQLDLWPADNERGLYLLKRVSLAFEKLADERASLPESDPEEVSKLRTAAKIVSHFSADVLAQFVANKMS